MRKKPVKEPQEYDREEEEYEWDDFSSDESSSKTFQQTKDYSDDILEADMVKTVRFYTAKKGYNFDQVEIFVKQVQNTLEYYEDAIYQKDLSLHENRQEISELQDRVLELQATIEVFRAKGDPLVHSDGSYVTESQLNTMQSEESLAVVASLEERIADLQRELTNAQTESRIAQEELANRSTGDRGEELESLQNEIQKLQAENISLVEKMQVFAQERDQAIAAEEEMRAYVEVTLAGWLAAQEEKSRVEQQVEEAGFEETSKQDIHDDAIHESPIPAPLVPPAGAPVVLPPPTGEPVLYGDETITEEYEEAAPEDTPMEAPVSHSGALSSDWGEDMPELGNTALESEIFTEETDPITLGEELEEGYAEPEKAESDRLNIILSAPELGESGILITELPLPSGSPIPGLPDPPQRKRSPITDAPELQGYQD